MRFSLKLHLELRRNRQAVGRCYQINLILRSVEKDEERIQRFKIPLNRSEIVNIEAMQEVQNSS